MNDHLLSLNFYLNKLYLEYITNQDKIVNESKYLLYTIIGIPQYQDSRFFWQKMIIR
jgi:hypothetical protein